MPTVHLFQTAHEMPWGLLIAMYLFYTGISAGAVLVTSLGPIFGVKELKKTAQVGAVVGLSLLIIAPLHLIFDLEQPLRFVKLLFNFHATSPMSYGVFILLFYGISLVLYLWSLTQNNEKNIKIFGPAAFFLAVGLEVYTGLLLGNVQAHALWNTALMPVIFLFSGLASGTAMVLLVLGIHGKMTGNNLSVEKRFLAKFFKWFVLADLALMAIMVMVLLNGNDAQYAMGYYLLHEEGLTFIWLENIIGLLLPFALLSISSLARKGPVINFSAILVVLSTLLMRINIVIGGQKLPLTGNSLLEYSPKSSHLLMAIVLAVLGTILIGILTKVVSSKIDQKVVSTTGKGVVS
ncbi:Polysulphide reductase NrfD [Desulfitobacterium hafniense DCB-2]|uniref:Polysulphide reductase NrfD n=1 Tax=Desulfitobacterium hafniense (strain DSM 10664 / DCB-2) TaxID=272564 RepID=B8G139_DESHD|nr:NrfD/PsrC family molybdoenzyme membrane anchor subunit [Desulfitobacterium hafniense]ACL19254.1 Polysulphide reductase NrfD [Desulfitobacterium hafniense DCB-2]